MRFKIEFREQVSHNIKRMQQWWKTNL